MNDEVKRVLEKSVRILKAKGGMENREIKPVILDIEKLIRKRRTQGIKRA